jgi:prepilin-type N-terminal cleavage/methylation domain-containing protein
MISQPRCSRGRQGFTLIELLVVVALIAGLSAVFIGDFGGGRRASALASGQVLVSNLVTAARTQAMATGQSVRIYLNVDPTSAQQPSRYLRCLVLRVPYNGQWQTISSITLPEHVYVVPGIFTSYPGGLFPSSQLDLWIKSDGSVLRSTVFQESTVSAQTVESTTPETWAYFSIASAGTTAQAGNLVLALGRLRANGSYSTGESPIELTDPESTRGLKLSQYGVPTLINHRTGF